MTQRTSPSTFRTGWKTVWLLLGISRRRAVNRARRQQELLNSRTGRQATNWNPIFFLMGILLMAAINLLAALVLKNAVEASHTVETIQRVARVSEAAGGGGNTILVSQQFLDAVIAHENNQRLGWKGVERFPPDYISEAKRIAQETGGSQAILEQRLRETVRNHRLNDLITQDELRSGRQVRLLISPNPKGEAFAGASGQSSFKVPVATGRFPAFVGSLILFLWASMLVCQGEGLELDMQRRRHPMWEWLYSHPVPTSAIFFAEMLSPIGANPLYWGAPLFAGFTYGFNYGPGIGLLATFAVGVPVSVAAACLGKALEIGIILRFSPRARGGIVGLMNWVGYATMMLFLAGLAFTPNIVGALGKLYGIVVAIPWPWFGLFLGMHADGSLSFVFGFLVCWTAAIVTTAGAVWFSVWGAQRGLSGSYAQTVSRPSSGTRVPRFGKEPLYRKEFLWFIRDRSAIVQTILIPLTVAGYQAFNFRFLLAHAQGAWNYLCGTAILFGTYFLWVLGPKSLASEGQALWIALTWPRGLENLLKAKAWLWSMISSGLVAIILGYAVFLFPHSAWRIALVGVGWFFFGRSMAEKSVTLVTVTSESGEVQKVPRGRYWATQLGMLTFAIGILTQQWSLAIVGIVYSYITAAAMWQNFRARLPYLYDPWSERVPPPPTLMHSMIGISILVEGVAVFTAVFVGFLGTNNLGIAQAFAYGVCAIAVSIGMSSFLDGRSVSPQQIWCWEPGKITSDTDPYEAPQPFWRSQRLFDARFLPWLAAGAAGGLLLGGFALGYVAVLMHIPGIAEPLRKARELMVSQPSLRISYAIMAVFFAPFAEEYLFRGLLYRALDREWGGWRAVLGSAAFFAIYHPPTSWLPVGLLGAANAILFKKSGRLAPAILLHMLYNAVVSIG
jgi:hypothetical protein